MWISAGAEPAAGRPQKMFLTQLKVPFRSIHEVFWGVWELITTSRRPGAAPQFKYIWDTSQSPYPAYSILLNLESWNRSLIDINGPLYCLLLLEAWNKQWWWTVDSNAYFVSFLKEAPIILQTFPKLPQQTWGPCVYQHQCTMGYWLKSLI